MTVDDIRTQLEYGRNQAAFKEQQFWAKRGREPPEYTTEGMIGIIALLIIGWVGGMLTMFILMRWF